MRGCLGDFDRLKVGAERYDLREEEDEADDEAEPHDLQGVPFEEQVFCLAGRELRCTADGLSRIA